MTFSETNLIRERHDHLIAGEWVRPQSGKYFVGMNPSTGEKLGTYARGNAADVDKAVRAAQAVFEQWCALDPARRGRTLTKVAELIRHNMERLTYLEALYVGKPLASAANEVEIGARHF